MHSDSEKLDDYIISNQKFFPSDKIIYLREKMSNVSDEELDNLIAIDLRDPSTFLLVSIFVGVFGIDRFMFGDVGYGLIKLLTFGGFGILTIMDWFTIVKRTKEHNFNKIILSFS